jgi:hypothetical protein
MKRVVVAIPLTWQQPRPELLEYTVGDGGVVAMSNVQALPEDPPAWMSLELARRAGGAIEPPPVATRLTIASGWPALLAEATLGDDKLLLILYQFLEFGAVASFRAPAATYDAHRDAVRDVLTSAQISWGDPPLTIAGLFAGAAPADK